MVAAENTDKKITLLKALKEWTLDEYLICVYFVLVIASLYGLFFFQFNFRPLEEKKFGILESDQKFLVKRNGNFSFEEVNLIEPIYYRDIAFVPPNAKAAIKVPNVGTFELPEDTFIYFDETLLDNLIIGLNDKRPPLFTFRTLSVRQGESLPDPNPMVVRLNELRKKTYAKIFEPLHLLSVRPITNMGPELSIRDFKLVILDPTRDQIVNVFDEKVVSLGWSLIPLKNVSYTVKVSPNSLFTPVLEFTTERKTNLFMQLDKLGRYYWRVKAQHNGDSISSDSNTFILVRKKNQTALEKARSLSSDSKGETQ